MPTNFFRLSVVLTGQYSVCHGTAELCRCSQLHLAPVFTVPVKLVCIWRPSSRKKHKESYNSQNNLAGHHKPCRPQLISPSIISNLLNSWLLVSGSALIVTSIFHQQRASLLHYTDFMTGYTLFPKMWQK